MDLLLQKKVLLPTIFNFQECLWFLDRGFDECLYTVGRSSVSRAVEVNGCRYILKIKQDKRSEVRLLVYGEANSLIHIAGIQDYVDRWLDLRRDLSPFYQLIEAHPAFSYMTSSYYGLRMIGIPDLFEAICWCIIGQQINLKFAYTLKRRLVERYGTCIGIDGNDYWLFPTPTVLRYAEKETLRLLQFSKQKIAYLIQIAESFAEGRLSLDQCLISDDGDRQRGYLQSFRGIGPWTANYVMMKCLGRTDCVPWGDAGIQSALLHHKVISHRRDNVEIRAAFDAFRGWESYLTQYLWRSLSSR